MQKYKTGLFIGRFQPFHLGHLSAIIQGLDISEKLIIIIGSANKNFEVNNPLTISERLQILKKILSTSRLEKKVIKLTTSNDQINNLKWINKIIDSIPKFDVVIGNNNLITSLTKYKGYHQFHPQLTHRQKHQGVIIRQKILNKQEWKILVPEEIIPMLNKFKIESRLRLLAKKTD